MPRRIPPKTARKANARVHNVSKWAFWLALAFIASLAHSVWSELRAHQNREAVLIGKSVDCVERPAWDYFAFCNGLRDGAACSLESRSRMMEFYEPIDYACAKTEPQKQFRFPVNREPVEVEYAEAS